MPRQRSQPGATRQKSRYPYEAGGAFLHFFIADKMSNRQADGEHRRQPTARGNFRGSAVKYAAFFAMRISDSVPRCSCREAAAVRVAPPHALTILFRSNPRLLSPGDAFFS